MMALQSHMLRAIVLHDSSEDQASADSLRQLLLAVLPLARKIFTSAHEVRQHSIPPKNNNNISFYLAHSPKMFLGFF